MNDLIINRQKIFVVTIDQLSIKINKLFAKIKIQFFFKLAFLTRYTYSKLFFYKNFICL